MQHAVHQCVLYVRFKRFREFLLFFRRNVCRIPELRAKLFRKKGKISSKPSVILWYLVTGSPSGRCRFIVGLCVPDNSRMQGKTIKTHQLRVRSPSPFLHDLSFAWSGGLWNETIFEQVYVCVLVHGVRMAAGRPCRGANEPILSEHLGLRSFIYCKLCTISVRFCARGEKKPFTSISSIKMFDYREKAYDALNKSSINLRILRTYSVFSDLFCTDHLCKSIIPAFYWHP